MKTRIASHPRNFRGRIWIVVAIGFAAISGAEAAGVVVFTSPPADYPEAVEFQSFTKANVAFSYAVPPIGKRMEIPNAGIIAIIENPPIRPDAKTAAVAAQELRRIDAVLTKYPRNRFPALAQKLEQLAARWHASQAVAQSTKGVPALAATPAGPGKLTITTSDGRRYDDVVITKVNAESISFEHSTGVAMVDLAKLPPDLQRRFNYDPKKVVATKTATLADAGKSIPLDRRSPAPALAVQPEVTKPPTANPATSSPVAINSATHVPSTLGKDAGMDEADRDYLPKSELVYTSLKKLGWSPELGKASDNINVKMHGAIDFPEKLPGSMDALFDDASRRIADQLDKSEEICAKEYWVAGFASHPPADDSETKDEWDFFTRRTYDISNGVRGYTYGVFCGVRVAYASVITLDFGAPDAIIRSPENWFSASDKLSNAFDAGTTGDVDARVESIFGKHTLAEQSDGFKTEFQKGVIHGYGEGVRLYMYGKLNHIQWRPLPP